ncbi:uncharacterized protein GGS25DRAFT_442125 [Hypoxylon fragiforme]|uniref:uncharacterized protein n=1 Tax=Hypoxylon fragiforme TaxID=63214 RepID=UPI0020C6F641|nr:uncharacterized protein GGS25DRAFT_442125 [Hypoxylon fragiforme]KAI2603937.1 hypothetical protein GGS25DRAFT_442125 [Hypoxylon fragiforme]
MTTLKPTSRVWSPRHLAAVNLIVCLLAMVNPRLSYCACEVTYEMWAQQFPKYELPGLGCTSHHLLTGILAFMSRRVRHLPFIARDTWAVDDALARNLAFVQVLNHNSRLASHQHLARSPTHG